MNDPHEEGSRVPEVAKHGNDEKFLLALNDCLALHYKCPSLTARPDLPIIYIVGAPRSGTTLLSQVLSRYLQVGYIDNLIARYWLAPEVGVRLSQILLGRNARESISFKSRHGVTENVAGPHEFGYFWRHWLRLDNALTHHLTRGELDRIDADGLKQALECRLLGTFGIPLLFKNVICGFQAQFLTMLHPNSIFIHIKRDLRDTAASILKSRFERYGSYGTWWSLKPSSFATLPNDPVEQVLEQVIDCRAEIDASLSQSGAQVLDVDYADFCHDPNKVLERLCELVNRFEVDMSPLAPVTPFQVAGCVDIPDAMKFRFDYELTKRYVR